MPEKTAEQIRSEAVAGDWVAVIADRYGWVYTSVEDAREDVEDPEDELTISVVRGSARPNDRNGTTGTRLREPGSHHCCDKAYEVEAWIDDPDDESIGAEARYAQAQAMAAGLNVAAREAGQ